MAQAHDAMLAKLHRKQGVVQRVLATTDGAELLQILKQEFFLKGLKGKSPEEMAFNLGACDVIAYLEQLNQKGE